MTISLISIQQNMTWPLDMVQKNDYDIYLEYILCFFASCDFIQDVGLEIILPRFPTTTRKSRMCLRVERKP